MTDAPAGFARLFRTSPFLDTVGPLFSKGKGADLVIGVRIGEGRMVRASGTFLVGGSSAGDLVSG